MIPPTDDIDETTRAALNAALAEERTHSLLRQAITANGRYRIVERFDRRERYHSDDEGIRKLALYVDVETTGTDIATDVIIQLAALPFEFTTDGRIFRVHACEVWYEDPGRPIPETVTELTGISIADVQGKRIDDERVQRLLADAVLVIAHKASFDRPMLERRVPSFTEKHWACSCDDIPWEAEGLRGRSLEWLAFKQCQMFYEAHRAESDCGMAVHLLSTTLPKSGRRCLEALLESARRKTVRVWAIGSDYATKEILKRRRYFWNDRGDGGPRAWTRDIPEDELDTELAWLAEHVYPGAPSWRVQIQRLNGRIRYSERAHTAPFLGVAKPLLPTAAPLSS